MIFFKKEKKRAGCIFMFFPTELLFNSNTTFDDFDAQKKPDDFKTFFYRNANTIKIFS